MESVIMRNESLYELGSNPERLPTKSCLNQQIKRIVKN